MYGYNNKDCSWHNIGRSHTCLLLMNKLGETRKYLYCFEPISVASTFIYILNRFLLKPYLFSQNKFVHFYLNDLLTFPVAFPFLLYIFRILHLRRKHDMPSLSECIIWLIVWSTIFELIGPYYFHQGTSDPLDIVCYSVGLVLLIVGIKMRVYLTNKY